MAKTCNKKNSDACVPNNELIDWDVPLTCVKCGCAIRPEHSPIGASSCERWWNCPGSVILMKDIPSFDGNKHTAEGTVAHTLGEQQLEAYIYLEKSGNDGAAIAEFPQLDDEVGRSYVEQGFEIEVSDDMVEAVEVYIQTVAEYLTEYGLSWAYDVRTEVMFDLTHIDSEAFGTCDAVIVAPMNRIIVIDYKHGKGHAVEVENNHQLLYYALGAYYEMPEQDRVELAYIETVIVQPRARHLHGGVRRHVYPISVLLEFEVELHAAIQRVRKGATDLAIGPWCKFCTAKPECPEQLGALSQATGLAFAAVSQRRLDLPKPEALTPDRLGQLMENASLLKTWISSVIDLATAVAVNGKEVTGYKIVEKTGNRRWLDESKVIEVLSADYGDKIFTKKVKTPAQMEKLVGKKNHDILKPYYEIPITGRTLVPEGDAREGTSTGAEAAFSAFADLGV